MQDDNLKETPVKGVTEMLAMTVGELLQRLVARPSSAAETWVEIRTCQVPYRELLSALKRGELVGSRIGRRYFVRRSELDRWMESRRITPSREVSRRGPAPSAVAHILEAAGYRKAGEE